MGGAGEERGPQVEKGAQARQRAAGKEEVEDGGRGHGTFSASEANEHGCLRFLYSNARSLFNKIDNLKSIIDARDPDLIFVTETWANKKISNAMLSIPGYNLDPELRIDRIDTTNGIGGGIVVYSREGLIVKPRTPINDFVQYCSFAVQGKHSTSDLNFIVFYRSPNSSAVNNEKLQEIISKSPDNSIIIGDLNHPRIN